MSRVYAKSADVNGYKEALAEHTIKDVKAGRRLVENLPFSPKKRMKIGFDLETCEAFHDLGKAATGFQKSLEKNAERWGKRHEVLSAVAAASMGIKDQVVFSILLHHKTLPSNGVVVGKSCLPDEELPYKDHVYQVWQNMAEEWNQNRDLLMQEWVKICKSINREDLLQNPLNLDSLLSENMMYLLDRDNQTKHFSYKERQYISLLRGLTITADHIASASNSLPIRIPRLSSFNLIPATPYNYQIKVGKKVGNVVLRAPTGSGKTEAALMWAQRNQQRNGRLFYTLPSTASLNAMYLRLKKSFNDTENKLIGLLHSRIASSIYSMLESENDLMSRQRTAWLLSSLVREMYFPIRICTPHQVMKFTLQGKGWELMLSEFPNSVFVFDEIHAYNPKHVGITMATAKYIVKKGGSVMVLSATLPKFLRRIIRREIPDISFMQPSRSNESDRKILEQKRHIIEVIDGNIIDNIDLIVREADKAKSTLVVCNHVSTAQAVYKEIKKRVNDTLLLHSQFARRDRNNVENELQRSKSLNGTYKPLPKIVVSTQVIEVSLDLDFEQAFTEPAPIDSLVQRMGRVNRYARRAPAHVRIFTKQYNKDNRVYSEGLRDKSLEVLSSLPNPIGEEDLNSAADRVYGKGYDSEKQAEYNEGLNCIDIKNMLAGSNRDWVEDIIDDKEGAIEVLPEPLLDRYDSKVKEGLVIEAFGLCVPVAKWRLGYLFKENRLDREHDPWIIRDCQYSNEVGLEFDGVT